MKYAIQQLQISLATALNNEPLWRDEGNIDQADLCLRQIIDFRKALNILLEIESDSITTLRWSSDKQYCQEDGIHLIYDAEKRNYILSERWAGIWDKNFPSSFTYIAKIDNPFVTRGR